MTYAVKVQARARSATERMLIELSDELYARIEQMVVAARILTPHTTGAGVMKLVAMQLEYTKPAAGHR